MTTFKETTEYKAYVAVRDVGMSPGRHGCSTFSETAEAAMEAAYNLGLSRTKIESTAKRGCEFKCPECGSYKCGTSNCTSPVEEWIGHCNGHGCKFEWPRSDDAKYGIHE